MAEMSVHLNTSEGSPGMEGRRDRADISSMIRLRHIVCPTDFSEFSNRALDYAVALAKWYAAEITVLYVFPPAQASTLQYLPTAVPLDGLSRDPFLKQLQRFVDPAR